MPAHHGKRYPAEVKDRAVRMVKELRSQDPADNSVISRVARQLGVGTESLRQWVKQDEVDTGNRSGHDGLGRISKCHSREGLSGGRNHLPAQPAGEATSPRTL